jgi:mRNA interferase MazF
MYKQGEILLIPIPFSDLSSQKQRPVLVLSNDIYNKITEDLVVAAITSKLNNLDYSIIIDQLNLC